MERTDVVIVGGGIAGGALGVQLARAGLGVTIVERSVEFQDRVRGETMPPWGYLELVEAGLLEVVLRAEGAVVRRYVGYGDTMSVQLAEAFALDAAVVLPGAAGSVNFSHPGACQALLDAAQALGAQVVRGASGVQVSPGADPQVAFGVDGVERTVRSRLVVGADGRNSVVRRQLGIALQRSGARTFAAGLLLDGVHEWPQDANVIGTWEDVHFLLFPRAGGRLRAYLIWDKEQPQRFAGPDGPQRMLERMATLSCLPDPELFRSAEPVGGCASYPMEDTWTDRPYAEGAVLVGDAAGYNDPIIGQGLSISIRDSRLVAEALVASDNWPPEIFEPYAQERAERMRRLCATAEAVTRLRADFTPEGLRRRRAAFARFGSDPTSRLPIAAGLVGPHSLPAEAFTREAADRMLALT